MSSFQPTEGPSQQTSAQNTPFVGVNGEVTGLGFATRDHGAKNEEDQGLLEFTTIKNDGTTQNMKLLIDLKNIFARQLPKMPKEYIVKLVCDRNHESLVIMRNKTKVIGGICYRLYPTQKFAEIAFLAVTATEQVKGYGTRLMNKYKDKMQKQGIEFLLTYADNYAIGYFKKQGFSKEHRMPPERWKGYIKDYDGGTFMECMIHQKIDYCNISNIIKEQKQYVIEQVKKLAMNEQLFDGLNFEELIALKKNSMRENTTSTLVNIDDIPGVVQSGWTYDDYLELKKTKERSFYLQCANIIELMRKHKSAWPFLEPVSKEDVVDYYEIITDPIDLKTMEKKLQSNYYQDKETFVNDVRRIFINARTYNQSETIYYKAANDLESYINPYLYNLKEDKHGVEEIDEEESLENITKKTKKKIPGIKKKISKHK